MNMSDMRFIMIGLVTVTIGFIVLGVFGAQFTEITVQTKEFSECYEYPENQPPIRIECDEYLQNKNSRIKYIKLSRKSWLVDIKRDKKKNDIKVYMKLIDKKLIH